MKGQFLHMKKYWLALGALLAPAATVLAQDAAADPAQKAPDFFSTVYTEPVFIALVLSSIFLLFLIMVLAEVIKSGLHHQREMMKKEEKKSSSGMGSTIAMIVLLIAVPSMGWSAEAAPAAAAAAAPVQDIPQFPTTWYGVDALTFWTLVSFIALEVIIVFFFLGQINQILRAPQRAKSGAAVKAVPTILERLNASKAIEEEHDILLDHNYDGIKELDNDLPPWWKYGFYFTIVAAVIYLFNYHVSKTGALQMDELRAEMIAGEKQKEEYKKKHADMVDENTVTLLTEASAIANGKGLFEKNCAVCHGPDGGGTVGPNLTDDYWIHGGDIKDIFKTIKFGYADKGMKSWQAELKPGQMQEVASYIVSLRGTKPAQPKAPEGELYVPAGATSDTTATVADSTADVAAADSLAK